MRLPVCPSFRSHSARHVRGLWQGDTRGADTALPAVLGRVRAGYFAAAKPAADVEAQLDELGKAIQQSWGVDLGYAAQQ